MAKSGKASKVTGKAKKHIGGLFYETILIYNTRSKVLRRGLFIQRGGRRNRENMHARG